MDRTLEEKLETCDLDYKHFYNKHLEEIAKLKMRLEDLEERNRYLELENSKLSAIKATVEVMCGRKFDG